MSNVTSLSLLMTILLTADYYFEPKYLICARVQIVHTSKANKLTIQQT